MPEASSFDLFDEALVAVEEFLLVPPLLPLPRALLTRMGVSYLTKEKPLEGEAIVEVSLLE